MEPLTPSEIKAAVQAALAEDLGPGDVTSLATVPKEAIVTAHVVAREPLVLAGMALAQVAFRETADQVEFLAERSDGTALLANETLLRMRGQAQGLLSGERVALNFLQRLSGVATLTDRFVRAVAGTSAKILDTRKTTPGWRRLEKYAVQCGGGVNHRMGLFDMVLIKDNHLAALQKEQPHAIGAAVRRARQLYPGLQVEVEADTLLQVEQALESAADIILLDNMSLEDLRAAVTLVAGRAKTEASGGVSLGTVRGIAETGVDFISVGALTHSARAVDIALDFQMS